MHVSHLPYKNLHTSMHSVTEKDLCTKIYQTLPLSLPQQGTCKSFCTCQCFNLFFFILIAYYVFLSLWLYATVIIDFVPRQDFWPRSIFLVTQDTSHETVLFLSPYLLSQHKELQVFWSPSLKLFCDYRQICHCLFMPSSTSFKPHF